MCFQSNSYYWSSLFFWLMECESNCELFVKLKTDVLRLNHGLSGLSSSMKFSVKTLVVLIYEISIYFFTERVIMIAVCDICK